MGVRPPPPPPSSKPDDSGYEPMDMEQHKRDLRAWDHELKGLPPEDDVGTPPPPPKPPADRDPGRDRHAPLSTKLYIGKALAKFNVREYRDYQIMETVYVREERKLHVPDEYFITGDKNEILVKLMEALAANHPEARLDSRGLHPRLAVCSTCCRPLYYQGDILWNNGVAVCKGNMRCEDGI